MSELTQEQKLALRLKQVLSEAGLHEIRVYVTPEKVIEFWIVESKPVEGLQKVVEASVGRERVYREEKILEYLR